MRGGRVVVSHRIVGKGLLEKVPLTRWELAENRLGGQVVLPRTRKRESRRLGFATSLTCVPFG